MLHLESKYKTPHAEFQKCCQHSNMFREPEKRSPDTILETSKYVIKRLALVAGSILTVLTFLSSWFSSCFSKNKSWLA
jgi:hypothetical protein